MQTKTDSTSAAAAKQAATLPTAGLRKYFAGVLRTERSVLRKFKCITQTDVLRKEVLLAKLEQTRFLARDISYFSKNPEVLA